MGQARQGTPDIPCTKTSSRLRPECERQIIKRVEDITDVFMVVSEKRISSVGHTQKNTCYTGDGFY